MKAAIEETSEKLGNDISHCLIQAGFPNVRKEFKERRPVSIVCVLSDKVEGST